VNHKFSPDDLARLLGLVMAVSNRNDCSTGEAIDRIEQSVTGTAREAAQQRPVAAYAAQLRRLRARRNKVVGIDCMRDPAWDMLLDLVAARGEGREVSVKALCQGSGVPSTTALRHVERLAAAGILTRAPHDEDSRRIVVRIAPDHADRIEDLVAMFRDNL
jgi:DNA-binding MarR family transcriptional regulator